MNHSPFPRAKTAIVGAATFGQAHGNGGVLSAQATVILGRA